MLVDYTDVTGVTTTEIPSAAGTFNLTEGCVLTATIDLPGLGVVQLKGIVVDQGKKMVGDQTFPPGAVATCTAERMSPSEVKP